MLIREILLFLLPFSNLGVVNEQISSSWYTLSDVKDTYANNGDRRLEICLKMSSFGDLRNMPHVRRNTARIVPNLTRTCLACPEMDLNSS